MGIRRDRPTEQGRGAPLTVRLRGGSTVSVSLTEPRKEPVIPAICCFCGENVELSDPRHVTVAARWANGEHAAQSWTAHDTCLADHLHESAKRAGLFPDR
jgi:hypothetical protein